MSEDKTPAKSPGTATTQTAETVARLFFRSGSDPASIKRDIRRWLMGVFWSVTLVPLAFYLRFGRVPPLGWATTVFFSAYCVLSAVGLYYLVRPEYHTPIALRNDWLDRVGALWLVTCVFGPFFGWVLASAFTLTMGNWWWLYLGRVILSVGFPVLNALPLLRYVRGRGAPVMLAILLGVTALPVWSAWATILDLRAGPSQMLIEKTYPANGSYEVRYLPHTGRVLEESSVRR
jgi:hypothetical protein